MADKISKLILASGSPRRRELLETQGLTFEIRKPDVPEVVAPGETPELFARRLAREKARAVWARQPGEVILAADTVVALGARILGKPTDREDAAAILRSLSGLVHEVITGVCVIATPEEEHSFAVRTAVRFRALAEADIQRYVATGEPMDKAGAYGIQGRGGAFVEAIYGSYSNVVGLPLAETLGALGKVYGVGITFGEEGER